MPSRKKLLRLLRGIAAEEVVPLLLAARDVHLDAEEEAEEAQAAAVAASVAAAVTVPHAQAQA